METQLHGLFIALVGVGGLFVVIALLVFRFTSRRPRQPLEAIGTVIDFEERDRDTITYAPMVEFATADRPRVVFTDRVSSDPPRYSVGDRVTVVYASANPDDAKIAGSWKAHVAAIVMLVLGLVVLAIGWWGM